MGLGRIVLDDDLILRFLDYYDGGSIREVRHNVIGTTEIVIEHRDMPSLEKGQGYIIPIVTPTYISHEDAMGHRVTMRERSDT